MMDSRRSLRKSRKSPVRYAEIPAKRDRSRSRGRGPKSAEKGSNEDSPETVKVTKPRTKSPKRVTPTRSSARRKVEEKVKKTSPLRLSEKSNDFEDIIRSSMTPDRAKIQEVIRSSVSRFEEVLSVGPVIKRRIRGDRDKTNSDNMGSEGLEHLTISENLEVNVKGSSVTSTLGNNYKNYNMNSGYRENCNSLGVVTLMFLPPTLVIITQLLCTQENCQSVPEKIVWPLKRFFDLEASVWYILFLATQFVLSSIPLGPVINGISSKGKELTYRRNGPGSLFLTVALLIGIRYFLNFPLIKVLDKTLPLLVSSILWALIIISALHFIPLKETNPNSSNNTVNFINKIWLGRDINPRLGPVDVKITLIRSCLITVVLYNGILLLKEIETKSNPSEYSAMLILICTLQILLVLDPLFCESSLISTFMVNQEGTGYDLIMSLAILPFWITVIPKYLYFSKPENNYWIVGITILLHLIGHVIYRISCSQYDNFLRNPQSKKSSDVFFNRHSEKVFQGGFRAKIRYPEYSGLLLIVISWCLGSLVLLPLHWIPVSVLIISLAAIIIRIRRLDDITEHHLAWMTCLSNTPSALIPYIY